MFRSFIRECAPWCTFALESAQSHVCGFVLFPPQPQVYVVIAHKVPRLLTFGCTHDCCTCQGLNPEHRMLITINMRDGFCIDAPELAATFICLLKL